MKCISCESEINPKFKHAIERNVCPFCGGSILEELLKSLLVSLADTMQKMQEYPDQLSDWLLSNYNYIKTDSPDLINFVPKEQLKDLRKVADDEDFVERKKKVIKVKVENGKEVEAITEKIQSDARTAGFFERAEIVKKRGDGTDNTGGDPDPSDASDEGEDVQLNPVQSSKKPRAYKSAAEKTRHLKELKKKIEDEGAQIVVGEAGLAAMIDPENLENADPEMVAAFQSELGEGDIIASALPVNYDEEDEMADRILSVNQSLASKNKSKDGSYNEQDMRSLREMHARVARSKKAFESGDNRGGKGGGFSRAG